MVNARRQQSGISLLGLLFWAVVLSFLGVVAARTIPTVMEFYTIQSAVDRIAKGNPQTVPLARAEFERIKQVEYSIQSIASQDLTITKDNDKVLISFAYEKQVALAGPVFLLIKYEGHSR
ncbi:DUF4845 domain-containing protein [Paucibacter sp. APW11]|uniref:DUF4845 domain-containing protein n=1 Tax=Roseateles aquae TaxID=3077235 RepID=A0ABU3PFH5_9BURK|nr:DUF4845 domain-containing protein [Paucibacter sp. APW11]MDT9001286.1 DUF4845 domain-containing protein [Paucibacter sp. APW11]